MGLIHWIGSRTQATSGLVSGCVRLLVVTIAFIKLKPAHAQLSPGELEIPGFSLSLTLSLDSVARHLAVSLQLSIFSLSRHSPMPLLSLAKTLPQYALINEAYALFSPEKC